MSSIASFRWAQQTFANALLGDKRRTDRLVMLAAAFADGATSSICQAFNGDEAAIEGAYRFLRNPLVNTKDIDLAGFKATAQRATSCHGTLLLLQDTTELAFKHAVRHQLGDLGHHENDPARGWKVQSGLLLDPDDDLIVGLLTQQRWMRDRDERGKRAQRKHTAYEDKESFKWQRTDEHAAELLGDKMADVITVCDREADVFEYLDFKLTHRQRFVVRSLQNRAVLLDEGHQKLRAALAQADVLGHRMVDIPQRSGRSARQAELELRAVRVKLRAPWRPEGHKLSHIEVNAVWAIEPDAPQGAKTLDWLILTSEPITSAQDLETVLDIYEHRWLCEDFHKCWKSGLEIEKRRMQEARNLERMSVLTAFVAVRLLELQRLGSSEAAERISCEQVFDEVSWKVLVGTMSKGRRRRGGLETQRAPSIRAALKMLAKLGGFRDSKRTGRPGWSPIWRGWLKLQERVEGFLLAQSILNDEI